MRVAAHVTNVARVRAPTPEARLRGRFLRHPRTCPVYAHIDSTNDGLARFLSGSTFHRMGRAQHILASSLAADLADIFSGGPYPPRVSRFQHRPSLPRSIATPPRSSPPRIRSLTWRTAIVRAFERRSSGVPIVETAPVEAGRANPGRDRARISLNARTAVPVHPVVRTFSASRATDDRAVRRDVGATGWRDGDGTRGARARDAGHRLAAFGLGAETRPRRGLARGDATDSGQRDVRRVGRPRRRRRPSDEASFDQHGFPRPFGGRPLRGGRDLFQRRGRRACAAPPGRRGPSVACRSPPRRTIPPRLHAHSPRAQSCTLTARRWSARDDTFCVHCSGAASSDSSSSPCSPRGWTSSRDGSTSHARRFAYSTRASSSTCTRAHHRRRRPSSRREGGRRQVLLPPHSRAPGACFDRGCRRRSRQSRRGKGTPNILTVETLRGPRRLARRAHVLVTAVRTTARVDARSRRPESARVPPRPVVASRSPSRRRNARGTSWPGPGCETGACLASSRSSSRITTLRGRSRRRRWARTSSTSTSARPRTWRRETRKEGGEARTRRRGIPIGV